jgi:hypothetical protein
MSPQFWHVPSCRTWSGGNLGGNSRRRVASGRLKTCHHGGMTRQGIFETRTPPQKTHRRDGRHSSSKEKPLCPGAGQSFASICREIGLGKSIAHEAQRIGTLPSDVLRAFLMASGASGARGGRARSTSLVRARKCREKDAWQAGGAHWKFRNVAGPRRVPPATRAGAAPVQFWWPPIWRRLAGLA